MKRETSSLRELDVKMSDIVSEFLDKHFYIDTASFERVNDKERQIQGIDVIFELNGKRYDCDEKAAIRYINKPLKTFSFELSFVNRGNEIQEGWLLDKKHINNSFLLIWVDKAKKDIIESIEDIESIQAILVTKEAIKNYLNSKGWSRRKLAIKGMNLRFNENEEVGDLYKNGLKFSVSRQLVEQPVNVLLTRRTLEEISVTNFIINL